MANKTKKIKAVFKGANGSCGYCPNFEYQLSVAQPKHLVVGDMLQNISITRADGSGICEYDSLLTFLDNWDNIKSLRQIELEVKEVTVDSEATVLGGHSAVGWFKEISGCYQLDRVREEMKEHCIN